VNTTTYDPNRYWVRSITAGPLSLTYNIYDNVGNVQSITDSRPGMNQSFGYDPLDRLTTANGPWGTATYGYDVHGNRLGGGAVYDTTKLRLLQTNGRTFGYSNNGNLQTSNADTFGYSPDNHLETSNVGGATTTYVYDADAWREKMTTAGTTSYFLRGANGELLTESRNPGGASPSTRDYIYAGTRLLSVVTVNGVAP
jgi:YD repeat-containing protein